MKALNDNIVFVETEPLFEDLEIEVRKHIQVVEAVMDEVIPFIPGFIESGVEVVISRGYTANLIREMTELHVVNVEITTFDVLQSMFRNMKNIPPDEKTIGLVSYTQVAHDIKIMEKIMGINIKSFTYSKPADIDCIFEEAKSLGIKTIFGGPTTFKLAPKHNIKAILIHSARETIIHAIQKASEIAEIRRRDRELNARLNAILNMATEGIIDISENGKVNLINPAAKRILGKSIKNKEELKLNDLPKGIAEIFKSRQSSKEQLVNTTNGTILVNSTPIKVNRNIYGSIVTFNDVNYVQCLEEKARIDAFAKGLFAKYNFSDIIGTSLPIEYAKEKAKQYAKSEATVLIYGESGTGKELFAQSIHQNSNRMKGPFVAINCAALSENLLESELFGYEGGAFTGAKKDGKPGMFELANKGTLFLDEIGEIPLHLQAHLLRVIQNKEVIRVGGTRVIPVDVRIITATNKNLKEMVEKELFRADLYYRINVLKIKVPPLRQRVQDIPDLINFFIERYSIKYNKTVLPFSKNVTEYLKSYDWPGNVRQLMSYIEKYVVLFNQEFIDNKINSNIVDNLALEIFQEEIEEESKLDPDKPSLVVPLGTLEEMEINILKQLELISSDKQLLADRLGLSRTTLWRKLQKVREI